MAYCHKWGVKNGYSFVLHFFSLISEGLGGVVFVQILDNYMSFFPKTIQMIRNNKWRVDCVSNDFVVLLSLPCPNWVETGSSLHDCTALVWRIFLSKTSPRRQTIDGRGDIDVSHGQFSKIIKLFDSPAARLNLYDADQTRCSIVVHTSLVTMYFYDHN